MLVKSAAFVRIENASARKAFGVPIISIRAGHDAAARESMTGRAHCLYPGWAGHETAARESMTGAPVISIRTGRGMKQPPKKA